MNTPLLKIIINCLKRWPHHSSKLIFTIEDFDLNIFSETVKTYKESDGRMDAIGGFVTLKVVRSASMYSYGSSIE